MVFLNAVRSFCTPLMLFANSLLLSLTVFFRLAMSVCAVPICELRVLRLSVCEVCVLRRLLMSSLFWFTSTLTASRSAVISSTASIYSVLSTVGLPFSNGFPLLSTCATHVPPSAT